MLRLFSVLLSRTKMGHKSAGEVEIYRTLLHVKINIKASFTLYDSFHIIDTSSTKILETELKK